MMDKVSKKIFYNPPEILELFKNFNLPINFCIVPFTNLIFNPGGRVSVCRQKGTDHFVGHLNTNTIDEIWNNEYMRNWRKEFLSGNVKICELEQKRDACHLWSSNYHFFNDATFAETQNSQLLKITANFNGQCNLQCTMCHIWKMENGFYTDDNFWNRAEKDFFPYIKEIELLSGEPFIQKDTYKLIDRISAVNPDCEWAFTTNAHWSLNNYLKEKLDKIKIKNIIISIDSLNEDKFAEIRKGGSLKRLVNTIIELRSYQNERIEKGLSELGLTVHFTAMRNNFFEALDIVDFCEKFELRHSFKTLLTPENLSVTTLSYEEQLKMLNQFIEMGSSNQLKKAMRVVRPLTEKLEPFDKVEVFERMISKINSTP